MPFGKCTWANGRPQFDWAEQPQPVLQQLDGKWFRLLESFAYRPPERDPDHADVFVVPGVDAPVTNDTQRIDVDGVPVVIPPNPKDGRTDIASVPWVFWWLIASYGNHTRAALLHDALVVDKPPPPVPRKTADRLFLAALREPEGDEKTGVFRHWLMWGAVAAFGTMNKLLSVVFVVHVLAVWGLVSAGLAWAWGPWLWPSSVLGQVGAVLVAVVGTPLVLILLGSFWRAGVDHTGGWLSPLLGMAAAFGVVFAIDWSKPFEVSPTGFFVLAAALTLVGFAWGGFVDRTLRWWLWPTVLLGLPIALMPVALILIAVVLVGALDVGAQLAKTVLRREPFRWPSPAPRRMPL